jgi:hypothetical protein
MRYPNPVGYGFEVLLFIPVENWDGRVWENPNFMGLALGKAKSVSVPLH